MSARRSRDLLLALTLVCAAGAANAQTEGQKNGFYQADATHTGAVSFEEFRNYAVRSFNDLDKNHDGVVTPDEYSGISKAVTIKDYNAALPAYFGKYDADKNGSLSLKEWAAVPDPKDPAAAPVSPPPSEAKP